jgi:hypothetical protein
VPAAVQVDMALFPDQLPLLGRVRAGGADGMDGHFADQAAALAAAEPARDAVARLWRDASALPARRGPLDLPVRRSLPSRRPVNTDPSPETGVRMVKLTATAHGPVRWTDEAAGWRGGPMATARKVILYAIVVFILYTIITSPARAADLVQVGFEGISNAAQGVGQFFTQLIQ